MNENVLRYLRPEPRRTSAWDFRASSIFSGPHLTSNLEAPVQKRQVGSIPYLSDNRRVELLLLPAFFHWIVEYGTLSSLHTDVLKVRSLLTDAMSELLNGLGEKKAGKLTLRVRKIRDGVIDEFFLGMKDAPAFTRGPEVAKIGLILWHAVEKLLQDGTLELYEGSAMADALMILSRMIEHASGVPETDEDAQQQAEKFIAHLRSAGFLLS